MSFANRRIQQRLFTYRIVDITQRDFRWAFRELDPTTFTLKGFQYALLHESSNEASYNGRVRAHAASELLRRIEVAVLALFERENRHDMHCNRELLIDH